MAQQRKKSSKRERKNIHNGAAHIQASFNNTIVTWPAGNNEATKLMRPSTALLAEASPPSDQHQPRAASAPRTEGPSQPPRSMPPVAVSGARTSPLARPIQPLASVSSRPLQHSAADSAAATFDHVRAASVGAEPDVTNILADLESRSSVSTPEPIASIARTRVESKSRRSTGNFLLAVLVLIAAGGAAAVVYFALPYLT